MTPKQEQQEQWVCECKANSRQTCKCAYKAQQEPVRLQCTTCGTVYADGVPPQVAQQEPVAWMCSDESLVHKGYSRFSRTCEGDWNIPVYTNPQAHQELDLTAAYMNGLYDGRKAVERKWVGLTHTEAADCWDTSATKTWNNIEAKLKEKNT